jgi:ribosomal-protein-alanine N-acetyltransferase
VWPELRGRGLGTQLIEAVIAEAAHLGATELTLEVRASNEPALRLYDRAGFQRAGVRKNYYTSPIEDAYILIRKAVKTRS